MLTPSLTDSLFIWFFLSVIFLSLKACVGCKEKSGLAPSRNESNAGQDSAEASGNGASKQVRRPDPGWAWARLAVASHSLFINGPCGLKSVHPLFMPPSQGNGAVTGKNPSHPPHGLNRILDNSTGPTQTDSTGCRRCHTGQGHLARARDKLQCRKKHHCPKPKPSGQNWVCI